MLKMCCYHYYLHLTEEWGSIPLEIRYRNSLSYKNIVSLFYNEKIILLNKTFSNQNLKKNALSVFNLKLKFKNIIITETQPVEKRYHSLQEEYKRVWKIRDDLETENDLIKDKLDIIKDELSKKDKLNKRLVNLLTIYKYHEFNNVEKYDYQEIKEKNKKLNQEFKRVYKLISKNIGFNLVSQ
jgi:DNA-binding ferritin-like protein (Dps family)